jgi:acetyltransferase-like isoleucine patch superfamily enzyme
VKEIGYFIAKVKSKLSKNEKESICEYFRKSGMRIGEECTICCNLMTTEPYLVEIGNNVTISGDVKFITHDNSICKIDKECSNVFGKIKIGDNCFIGQRSTILYGVELANNIIVAAGSVVVDSFSTERIIIGGNPARVISTWNKFYEKRKPFAMSRYDAEEMVKANPCKLVKRKNSDAF